MENKDALIKIVNGIKRTLHQSNPQTEAECLLLIQAIEQRCRQADKYITVERFGSNIPKAKKDDKPRYSHFEPAKRSSVDMAPMIVSLGAIFF